MFATLLAYQAHCALPDFRGKLVWLLVHGSILSRVGAYTKLGAVQGAPTVTDQDAVGFDNSLQSVVLPCSRKSWLER
ncbi:hypothetical protein GAS19_11520 [Burkholderia glumae]|nr:hypothetical protein GAS19_11520 [Burkholderia glumae]